MQQTLDSLETLRIRNRPKDVLYLLEKSIERKDNTADELAYLYAHQSLAYGNTDSLLLSKRSLDNSQRFAQEAKTNEAKAIAYRAEAALNRQLGLPDEVTKSALKGLQLLEKAIKISLINTRSTTCFMACTAVGGSRENESLYSQVRTVCAARPQLQCTCECQQRPIEYVPSQI
ncbi:hypothetical protein KUH03_08265 [Sphingobacterium sp. E70]|uniref:hypothetical protein n=1 Tax=Sphingobacterium sp. E70 TaxID=2853439 RepID=UPI00211C6026|nr:hypothetical protein [Sphingobacterium sp. E70]ULT26810.1 hypothetical protein KUH03_08265 [Sphingobacterium sp. E70]